MKVMAIVASARKLGNSTVLAKEMLAALPESVEKKVIRLSDYNIEPCKACYACLPTGSCCVIKDDFEEFLQEVRCADAIIIASPIYFLGMHTRLKLLCDRLISVLNEAREYTGRRCAVVVPYGVEGWQGYGVEATVSFARFLHLDIVGVLPVHAANPGEAVRPEILVEVRRLAGRLLPGNVDETDGASCSQSATTSGDITCNDCGSGVINLSANGTVRCVMCGASGKVSIEGASAERMLNCIWAPSEHFRYSVAGMGEHARRLEHIKAEFIARRHELMELLKPYKDNK
jgi:multimeric flavodoxin WrbA